ncbi:MAG: hypothetical protein H6867_01415 [Rhodospirillales bacterium]|nr:hypothetical protein [Rhodospirillales bacterium]MCB9997175.1 hypothetical protein [Rhodospirillales bacterium]
MSDLMKLIKSKLKNSTTMPMGTGAPVHHHHHHDGCCGHDHGPDHGHEHHHHHEAGCCDHDHDHKHDHAAGCCPHDDDEDDVTTPGKGCC